MHLGLNSAVAHLAVYHQPQALPEKIFHFSAVVNPCWNSQVTRSDRFVLCCFSLISPIVVSGRGKKKKKHPTTQLSPVSSPTYRCHCPEIGTQLPRRLRSIEWKNLSAKRVDACRGGREGLFRTTGEIGHRKGTNQSKQWKEEWRNIFKTVLFRLWCCQRMEALCFSFLQSLYFHTLLGGLR